MKANMLSFRVLAHQHIYFLEDGVEFGTSFIRNIGIKNEAAEQISSDETDNDPSIFWMSNPNNIWGKVADNQFRGQRYTHLFLCSCLTHS